MTHPRDSVDGRVKGSDQVSKEVAIIVTMMNDRSGFWEITEERTLLLSHGKRRLGPVHRVAIVEMLEAAQRGDRLWKTKAEFQSALLHLSRIHQRPQDQDIEKVLMQMRIGAVHDGVAGKPWVSSVMQLLERLLSHDLDAPDFPEGHDDGYTDSSFHLPPV